MIRLTALLVVFNLAGLPAANAACLAWCGPEPATTSHCHDEESPAIARDDGACAVLNERPFLREDPRPSFSIACGPLSYQPLTPAPDQPVAHVIAVGETSWARSAPLVLRL
jgi:hypothetical protein